MSQKADVLSATKQSPLSSDEFKALIDAMKSIHDGLFDRGFKITAALVGVIGWFGVKPNPLPQLCLKSGLTHVAITTLVFAFFSVVYLYVRDYQRAKDCEQLLFSCQVKPAVYSTYRLTPLMIAVGLFVQLGLFGSVGASIYSQYGAASSGNTCNALIEKPQKDNKG